MRQLFLISDEIIGFTLPGAPFARRTLTGSGSQRHVHPWMTSEEAMGGSGLPPKPPAGRMVTPLAPKGGQPVLPDAPKNDHHGHLF